MTDQQLRYYLENLNQVDIPANDLQILLDQGLVYELDVPLVDGFERRIYRKYALTDNGKFLLGRLQQN